MQLLLTIQMFASSPAPFIFLRGLRAAPWDEQMFAWDAAPFYWGRAK